MGYKFNPFSGNFDIAGSGGGGGASYIDGEVQNFSALPETVGSPAVDSAYLCREPEGTWLLNRKPAGIYIRTSNTGTRASDWTYAGEFPDVFNDANFVLYDNGDSTKNLQFQLSGIATGTTRTITVPNKNVTLDDAGDSRPPTTHLHQPSDVFTDTAEVLDATLSGGEPNGLYYRDGSDNGKGLYKSAEGYSIWWDDGEEEWVLGSLSQAQKYYLGAGDTAYPWQATSWVLGPQGSGDTPTVDQAFLSTVQQDAARNLVSTRTPKTGNASSTQVVLGNDTRLTNSRTPTAHAASHAAGTGSDPVFDQNLNTTDAVTFESVTATDLFGLGAFEVVGTSSNRINVSGELGMEFFGTTAASTRTNLGLGDAATADIGTGSTEVAAGDHGHGNLTSDGKLGSTSGLPVVTTTAGAVTTLALGTAGQVLTVNSGATGVEFAAASGGGSGGTKTYAVFSAEHNQPPSTAFATLDTRNSIAVLDFDAATDENAVFVGIMPEAASLGSGLIVRLHWMATTATSGNVRWGVQFERSNTDLDADSFDTAVEATAATNGTSGILTTTAITVTTIDGITAGDVFRLKVFRNADNATNDTMTGDAELVAVEVRSAA